MPIVDIEEVGEARIQPTKRSVLAWVLSIAAVTMLVATVVALAGPRPTPAQDVSTTPEGIPEIKLTAQAPRVQWLDQLPQQTATCSSNPFFAQVCRSLPSSCSKDQVDIHGNFPAASGAEDQLALKVYHKWQASTGADDMNCQNLRRLAALYDTAVVGERELSEDGVARAKDENQWPTLCENASTTAECRRILVTSEDIDVMNAGLLELNEFIDTTIKQHQKALADAASGTCKLLFAAFIDHAVSFKIDLQEPILCHARDKACSTQLEKKQMIYKMRMFADFRKGRAKTNEQKQEAKEVLGALKIEIDHTAGIEQDTSASGSDSVCTMPWEKGFFNGMSNSSRDFFHGKLTTQRCVDPSKSNPANLFQKANAPYICGLSGSILEIMRFNDAFAGRYISTPGHQPGLTAENRVSAVDDKFGLLLMALLDLGGHHSMTETGVSVKEWGLLSGVDPPFFADDSLDDMGDEEVAQLPKRYQHYLETLGKKIDETEFAG